MSNIYIQEPPTEGKVLLSTTAGEIEVELWSKEAPLACRNFVQLCLEGYYNKTVFHRVIPGFIAQGGDPFGTGEGGESIYGKPFKDEFHSRLRFVRRGLVAMANAGPNDNSSQFFFTLGPCKELHNKHTIFGKVAGDTLYNLPRFEEGDIGKDDRPTYPHSITKTEVLVNPFPDIVPREAISNEIPREDRKKKKKGVKNFSLLSFGGEAEEDEAEVISATKAAGGSGGPEPSLAQPRGRAAKDESSVKDRIREKLRKLSEADAKSKAAKLSDQEKKKKKDKKNSSSEASDSDDEENETGKENRKKIANKDRKRGRSEEKSSEKLDEQKRKKKKDEVHHEESGRRHDDNTRESELSQDRHNKSTKSTKTNDHERNEDKKAYVSTDKDKKAYASTDKDKKAYASTDKDKKAYASTDKDKKAYASTDKDKKAYASTDKRKKDSKLPEKSPPEAQENSEQPESKKPEELAEKADSEKAKNLSAIRAEIKQLKRELTGKTKKESEKETPILAEHRDELDTKPSAVQEYLNEKQKFLEQKKTLPKKKSEREDITLAMMEKFSKKVKSALNDDGCDEEKAQRADEDVEDDDDDWLRQKVLFTDDAPVLAKDANTKDDSWYALDDPRHPLNKRRRGENVPSRK